MALIEPNFNIEKHSIHRHDLGKEIAMLISMFSLNHFCNAIAQPSTFNCCGADWNCWGELQGTFF